MVLGIAQPKERKKKKKTFDQEIKQSNRTRKIREGD